MASVVHVIIGLESSLLYLCLQYCCSQRILLFRNFIFSVTSLVPCVGRPSYIIIAQNIFCGPMGSSSSFRAI